MELKKTRRISIQLSALTRKEYTEILEIPADMSDDDIENLVGQRKDAIESDEYVEDRYFWERGDSVWEPADDMDIDARYDPVEDKLIYGRNSGGCSHCDSNNIAYLEDATWECHDCGKTFKGNADRDYDDRKGKA